MEESLWVDDLIGCPSQCYKEVGPPGMKYVLYLRWRWDNPWQGHIILAKDRDHLTNDEAVWSEDLFEKNHLFFRENELEAAKEALYKLFVDGQLGME